MTPPTQTAYDLATLLIEAVDDRDQHKVVEIMGEVERQGRDVERNFRIAYAALINGERKHG